MKNFVLHNSQESALRRGIKAVGIGKKGSRSLTRELALEICDELQNGEFTAASRAAFFAALFIKGLTENGTVLAELFTPGTMDDAAKLAAELCAPAPRTIISICTHLLEQKELNSSDSDTLGQFLFSDEKGDGARGLAAIALRVRYETPDEYLNLLNNINKTIRPDFRTPVADGDVLIQLAEPFDGVNHNYLLTPCLADFLQKHKMRVITLVGRNSGPKFVNNVYDLAKKLNLTFMKNNQEINSPYPAGGFYIDQKDLSLALDRWVDLRHQIIKRPFLATLEKFLNPCHADIIITSAFHSVYGEKMAAIAEGAQFPGSIVVRNGVEGTIAFPLTRPTKLLCSARQKNGDYLRKEINFDAAQFFNLELAVEQKLDNPSLEINAALIKEFFQNGKTQSIEFDRRIAATCAGIKESVEWILKNTTFKEGK